MPVTDQQPLKDRLRAPILAALYLVAATAPRVAAFLLLPVYAFELTPAELAAYGIAVAIAQLTGILSDLGVLDGMGILYFDLPEEERPGYLKTTVLLSRVVSITVMVPIGIVLAFFWEPLLGPGLALNPGLWLVLAFAFLQRGNTIAGGIYRVLDQHAKFASTRIIPAIVQTIAGVTFVFFLHWGAAGAVAAAPTGFLVSIVLAAVHGRRAAEHTHFGRLSGQQLRLIVAKGAPVLPESIAKWAQMMSLRPLLGLFTTVDATAAFTFSNAPAQVLAPFTESYEQYVLPKYYDSCARRDLPTLRSLRDMTALVMAVGAIGTIFGIVVFDPLFREFAPAPYRATAGLAAIGLAGILMRGPMGLLVHALRVEDRRASLVLAVVTGLAVSYLQFFVLVPTFGAWSAAWSIYVYPATACVFMLFLLRDPEIRLVTVREFALTNAAILVVLVPMVVLLPDGDGSWMRLGIVAAIGLVAMVTVFLAVVRPRLATAISFARVGVTRTARADAGELEAEQVSG